MNTPLTIGSFQYWLNSDGIVTLAKSLKTGRFVSPKLIQSMLTQKANKMLKQYKQKSLFTVFGFFTTFTCLFIIVMFYVVTRQHHGHVTNDISLAKQFLCYAVISWFGMILSQKDE